MTFCRSGCVAVSCWMGYDGDGVLDVRIVPTDDRLPDRGDPDGGRGNEENRLRLIVKLFLKLLGGGLGF